MYALDGVILDDECVWCVPHKVTDFMNDCLSKLVTESEAQQAVHSMGTMKASGLDGFNGLFFQKNWGTIGKYVCKAVIEFF